MSNQPAPDQPTSAQPSSDQPDAQADAAPAQPAAQPAGHPPLPFRWAVAYMLAAAVIALSQGLQQGFVVTNLGPLAGDLGVTTATSAWLYIAYTIPRAALPVLLIKVRTQYGLRRFAELGIVVYVIVAFASVWITDFRSALVVQVLSGAAAAPLSTLGFLYMLEALAPEWKMRLGLPMALTVLLGGTTIARVVSPVLIGDGGFFWVHLTGLGLAMVSLMLVFFLPLRPIPRMKVIERMDFLSFALITIGFGGLIAAFVMGPIYFWTDMAWIGWMLILGFTALVLGIITELNRKAPLLDIRWLASPAILHLTATLFLFRLILSEQAAGAPKMFAVLGVAPDQMTTLFAIIFLASLMGGLACVAWMRPTRVPWFHLIALLIIAFASWLDSQSSTLTRPMQMIVSQALVSFASMLFIPPAMLSGLLIALAKGPQYLLSFVIIFISSQTLGGVLGSGLFSTFTTHRQAFHMQSLTEQLTASDPQTMQAIAGGAASLAGQISDAGARVAQATSQVVQSASAEAWVRAYDDAYLLTAFVALIAAAMLLLHLLRDLMARRAQTDIPGAKP